MVKKGRRLEKTIESLEKLLSKTNLKVSSPALLPDYVAGGVREVDIAIQGEFGSTNILIAIECRDHKNPQNVTWIEQLKTKRDAIQANKMIAVSSSGFSENATITAQKYGIETRVVANIDSSEISRFFPEIEFVYSLHKFNVVALKSQQSDSTDLGYVAPKPLSQLTARALTISPNEKIFSRELEGKRYTLNELLLNMQSSDGNWLLHQIPWSDKLSQVVLSLNFSEPNSILLVEFENKVTRIIEMELTLETWTVEKLIPMSKAIVYKSNEEFFAVKADFQFVDHNEKRITVSLQKDTKTGVSNLQILRES